MDRTRLQSEHIFARELIKLVHSHAGSLRPGQRAFWLMAAAIKTLSDESKTTVFRSGVQNAAGLVYDKISRYMPPVSGDDWRYRYDDD